MMETLKEPGLYRLAAERAVQEVTPMAMGETLRDFMVRVGVRWYREI
jgi:hypothetical protein